MAIAFDTEEALDEVWNCHQEQRLTPVLHNILLTPRVIKAVSTTRIRLEVRLWDDEYHACKNEIQSGGMETLEKIQTKSKNIVFVIVIVYLSQLASFCLHTFKQYQIKQKFLYKTIV